MLHVHRSERADRLVAPLARVLAEPVGDPFALEVVAVPTRGVERWLAQSLSHHLGTGSGAGDGGVCAGVRFDSPARLVADVLGALAAEDGVGATDPADDPWRGDRLTWTVLDILDRVADEPWCAGLGRHLGTGDEEGFRRGRRLSVARHIAELFTSYGVQRPAMIRGWVPAQTPGPPEQSPFGDGPAVDGAGGFVPDDLAWQPRLWRLVREQIGVPSPADRLELAIARLDEEPARIELPPRISVFGPTRLPEEHLQVLAALSRSREVHLWLAHPSPALWERVDQALRSAEGPLTRASLAAFARHPLLASMGKDVMALQARLHALPGGTLSQRHRAPEAGPDAVPEAGPDAPAPSTLLGVLQRSIVTDDPAGPGSTSGDGTAARSVPAPGDRSLEVHACHGHARQVEVLRDLVVGLLADDPTLQPRDIIVMCPDIESFAPLLVAAFGQGSPQGADVHPGQGIRVRLADRSVRQVNPHLDLLATVLELADSRVTLSQVLDLVSTEPVRRRFRFDDDDIARIREWAVEAGVHWGEGAARRARFSMDSLRQGTWQVGMDRVLLGAAMAEEDQRFLASALPLDDVDSNSIDLAGRLAEFVDRLELVLARLDGAHPLRAWLDELEQALDLLAEASPAQAWQGVQARQVLADVLAAEHGASADGAGLHLRLPDVRALLADRLRGRPTRAGFRTGALTMCSLEPMRAVPHRVVCLLGLDDGVFPRRGLADGDDILLRNPTLGERDRRAEDRQLFLDAVMAAEDALMVLYSGADERTGARRPPAVPVSELLDAIDRLAAGPDGLTARDTVLVRHPLQSVDDRAFTPGALRRSGAFSFDGPSYRAALTARGPRDDLPEFLPEALAAEPLPELIELDDLIAVFEHPARWFARRRLGLRLPDDEDDESDRLPLELDPLSEWAVGERMLTAVLGGVSPRQAGAAEWRRGVVPPRQLGRAVLERVEHAVIPVAAAARHHARGLAQAVDVIADLPSGVRVTGTVPGVCADTVVRAVYSRLGPKHRVRAWMQVLALAATEPQRPWEAVTIGRAASRRASLAGVARVVSPGARAGHHLDELVRLRRRATQAPLPLPVAVAFAYARARHAGESTVNAVDEARAAWENSRGAQDAYQRLCWGETDAFAHLLAAQATATELAWWPQEQTRFGVLARRVWHPLLEHEEVHVG